MGKTEEIAKVEAELQALSSRRQKIAEGYTIFATRITTQIEKILKDAEVYDVIRALEVGRDTKRVEDQAQADAIGKQLEELAKVRAVLVDGQPSDAPPSDDGAAPTA